MEVLHIDTFDFSRISLGEPQAIQGGSYYARLHFALDNLVCVQLPRCTLKQGIVTTKKGKYCDLMYDRLTSACLVDWIENLENAIQDKIDGKKALWFQSELTRDDIETMMTPLSRSYKSGRRILMRMYLDVSKQTNKDRCIVYDENESIMGLDTLDTEREIVPLIQIEGIRFTSRSFEVDVKLVQAMALHKRPDISEVCLIKMDNSGTGAKSQFGLVQPVVSQPTVSQPVAQPVAQQFESPQPSHLINEQSISDGQDSCSEELSIDEQDKDEDSSRNIAPSITFQPEVSSPKDPALVASSHTTPHPPRSIASVEPVFTEPMPTVEEVNLDLDEVGESMTLRKPDEVYYEIYRAARDKAKRMRQAAVEAYLDARQIKSKYLLNDIDSSDEDEDLADPKEGSAI